MTKINFLIVFLLGMKIYSFGQNVFSRNLGNNLYDHYLDNSAFIVDNNMFNIDFFGRTNFTSVQGFPMDGMGVVRFNSEKYNSGILVGYNFSTFGLTYENRLKLGYSYGYTIDEKNKLKVGSALEFENINYKGEYFYDFDDEYFAEPFRIFSMVADLGIGIETYGFKLGISSYFFLGDNQTDGSEKCYPRDKGFMDAKVLVNYQLRVIGDFSVIPQYNYNVTSHYSLFFDYQLKYRVGLTYSSEKNLGPNNLLLVSSSLVLYDNFEFTFFFNPDYRLLYSDNFDWNLLGKIGIRFP